MSTTLKSGAVLNFRPRVKATPLPPPIEYHSAQVHRLSAYATAPAYEPDPVWFVWVLWPVAFVAVVIACVLWPFGDNA